MTGKVFNSSNDSSAATAALAAAVAALPTQDRKARLVFLYEQYRASGSNPADALAVAIRQVNS